VKLPKGEKSPLMAGRLRVGVRRVLHPKNPGRITNSLQTKWGKIISISQKYPTN
jgi:hypothetical protein